MVDTYIVFDSDLSDQLAAQYIADKRGFILLQTAENADPSVPNTQRDDNNIVCIGLWLANAYTKYYFPNLRQNAEGKLKGEFDISADGKRIISTKKRANGTTVTVVAGIAAEDTLRAAHDFADHTLGALIPIVVAGSVTIGTVVAIART